METHINRKLQLPTTTLLMIDCVDIDRAIRVMEICKQKADFGAVKLLTSIPNDYPHSIQIMPINSLIAYSIFMLSLSHEYIETDFVQIVQRDGWILNPESFKHEWLEKYDFIGPLYMQYPHVGSGGFSLRSKRIMQEVSKIVPRWDGTQKHADQIQRGLNYYEDGILTLSPFSKKFRIASLEDAADYAQGGNRDPKYFREYPYGFHRTFQDISFDTGRVDSSDLTKDIHVTYDNEIDSLI